MTSAGPGFFEQAQQGELLKRVLEIGVELSATRDRRKMLEMILTEARRIAHAQAGTLYIRRKGNLEFVVCQNDQVDLSRLDQALVGQHVQIDSTSIAGFVASTGTLLNVPDSYRLMPGMPFRINRDFDAATGYRTVSILAIPLKCPDGQVVGVLQLINHIGPTGRAGPFPNDDRQAILSLASMAAVSIHAMLLTDQLKQAHLDTIIRLSVVAEFRDRATAEHIRRISHLSARIARQLALHSEQVELIQCAGAMHDIGKIGIPDSILLKPGPLTAEERRRIETHTLIGAEILGNPTNELMVMAREIALSHHERFDGGGYPNHLKGAAIPLSARIVCLADVFDALATRRCYKDAYPIAQVLEILHAEIGRHFDPNVAGAFFQIADELSAMYATDPAAAPGPAETTVPL